MGACERGISGKGDLSHRSCFCGFTFNFPEKTRRVAAVARSRTKTRRLHERMHLVLTMAVWILMTMKAYYIRDWNELYENNVTRTITTLNYFCKRIKFHGEGVGFVRMQPGNGMALYGIWTFVIESLAASAEKEWRGWLVRNGSPLTALRMSAITQVNQQEIQRALDFFSTTPMNWLEFKDWPGAKQSEFTATRQSTDGKPSATRQSTDGNSARGKKNSTKTEEVLERDKRRGFGSVEAEAAAQKTQWVAATSQISKLEAVDEEDRTSAQRAELKKWREVKEEISKKQARGDFSLVEVEVGE
jgi:hypothetical protein